MNKQKLYLLITLLASMLAIYQIAFAIYIRQTTGILKVTSSKPTATLTVSQTGHQSVNIGVGDVVVHLKPGSYKVTASDSRDQVSKSLQIQKMTKSYVDLSLTPTSEQTVTTEKIKNSNLFTQLLPYSGPGNEYRISYAYSFQGGSSQATILIYAPSAQAKQDAASWIKNVGFDPDNLNISYITSSSE